MTKGRCLRKTQYKKRLRGRIEMDGMAGAEGDTKRKE